MEKINPDSLNEGVCYDGSMDAGSESRKSAFRLEEQKHKDPWTKMESEPCAS